MYTYNHKGDNVAGSKVWQWLYLPTGIEVAGSRRNSRPERLLNMLLNPFGEGPLRYRTYFFAKHKWPNI